MRKKPPTCEQFQALMDLLSEAQSDIQILHSKERVTYDIASNIKKRLDQFDADVKNKIESIELKLKEDAQMRKEEWQKHMAAVTGYLGILNELFKTKL